MRDPQVGVLDVERLRVKGGAGCWEPLWEPPVLFSLSSIERCSAEGGSSDVAVKLLGCVRVQLSRGRRKQGIKRGEQRARGGERGRTVSPRRDACRAHRGRTHTRADMEGSAEEDYKEKLLWNVKREVGAVNRHPPSPPGVTFTLLLCHFFMFSFTFKRGAGSVALKNWRFVVVVFVLFFKSRVCYPRVVSGWFQFKPSLSNWRGVNGPS